MRRQKIILPFEFRRDSLLIFSTIPMLQGAGLGFLILSIESIHVTKETRELRRCMQSDVTQEFYLKCFWIMCTVHELFCKLN
jgi:hypothetical protein